jgi:hypothetical protein
MRQTHDFLVSDPKEEAIRKARTALQRVGELTEVVPGKHLSGTIIALGSKVVKVRISWREEVDALPPLTPSGGAATLEKSNLSLAHGTTLILETDIEDGFEAAEKNAVERFEDAYRNHHNPDYAADRVGFRPVTIIALVIAFVLTLVFFYRSPLYKRMFPSMPAQYLKDDKEKKEEAAQEQKQREEMGETTSGSGTSQ